MKFGHIMVLLLSSVGIAFGDPVGSVSQLGTDGMDPWLKAGVAVISLAALIWVVQHLLRNLIPEQQRIFRETMDAVSERSEKRDERWQVALNQITKNCADNQERWLDRTKE